MMGEGLLACLLAYIAFTVQTAVAAARDEMGEGHVYNFMLYLAQARDASGPP